MTNHPLNTQILIIGGGLAGLTSAIHLTKMGCKVIVIEKNSYPKHKVCGEYISNEVLPYFAWLQIHIEELKPTHIWNLQFSSQTGRTIETPLPLGGFGISRFTLDEFLYQKALSQNCEIIEDHRSSRAEMETINQEFSFLKNENIQFLSLNKDALNIQHQQDIVAELKTALGADGKIRCLLHSIAKGNLKPMIGNESASLSTDDFSITLQAMATSLYDWTKLIFDENIFAKDVRILAFTSEGSTKPINHYGAVSAAKAALEAISRNIALEFAPFGFRSNCIQAGVTDTRSLQMIPGSEEIKEYTKKRNPFKRLTTPEDVANVVSLLCQDEASWINGCVIPVDGGEHLS